MSEDKDKMHLAELEQDVLGEPLTHLEESAMQNTIKLTIENKRLQARIAELEAQLNNEWKDVSEFQDNGGEVLVRLCGKYRVVRFIQKEGCKFWVQHSKRGRRYETSFEAADIFQYITPPTQEGDKE